MRRRSAEWAWTKVSSIHRAGARDADMCAGPVYSYCYRLYQPWDRSYERCVGLAWCTSCREYTGAMVFVPREEHLPDPLAELSAPERERLARSEVKLLDHLDRLVR